MLKFLSKLLSDSKPDTSVSKSQNVTRKSMSRAQREPVSEKSSKTGEALDHLWSKIAHLSHPEYRFLHPTYSPSSRVPCADFTPFIIDRLRNHDVTSIQQLMRAVIAGNPGLGIEPEWIDESVREIVGIDFSRYCHCPNSDLLLELQALFILGAKDGGGREFLIADEIPLLFAYTLCCQKIQWLEGLEELRNEANRFIRKMRKDTPFWETYPLFGRTAVESQSVDDCPIASQICMLPLLSRLHLLSFAERGCGSLMQSTTYKMRSLGLNPVETVPIVLASGICEPTSDLEALDRVFSKNDLVVALNERKIPYRKSWKKLQLLEALASHAPDFLTHAAERERTARIKDAFLPQIRSLNSYANALQEPLKLLCFATAAT